MGLNAARAEGLLGNSSQVERRVGVESRAGETGWTSHGGGEVCVVTYPRSHRGHLLPEGLVWVVAALVVGASEEGGGDTDSDDVGDGDGDTQAAETHWAHRGPKSTYTQRSSFCTQTWRTTKKVSSA